LFRSLLDIGVHAGLRLQRLSVLVELSQFSAGFGLAIWPSAGRHRTAGTNGDAVAPDLLGVEPASDRAIGALAVRQYPTQRNVTLRILEPLTAAEREVS
jgi:hypothetical protein